MRLIESPIKQSSTKNLTTILSDHYEQSSYHLPRFKGHNFYIITVENTQGLTNDQPIIPVIIIIQNMLFCFLFLSPIQLSLAPIQS